MLAGVVYGIFFTLLFFAWTCTGGLEGEPSLERQTEALAALYNSTDGSNWIVSTSWLSGDPCTNQWYGIKCENDLVVSIDLDFNNLVGTLPDNFGDLNGITSLTLSDNSIEGQLPASMSMLVSLQDLHLGNNALRSVRDVDWSALTSLTFIDLDHCSIMDDTSALVPLPESLQFISISSNEFRGTLPSAWLDHPTLTSLEAVANKLSGTLPEQLCYNSLTTINLAGNTAIGGTIPDCTFSCGLLSIALGQLNLTGSIPSIGNPHIETINIYMNHLEGTLPDLASMCEIQSFEVYKNNLYGELPERCSSPTNDFIYFDASNNRFSGTIPQSWTAGPSGGTAYVDLSDNSLVCPLPETYAENMTLILDNNLLTGSIPAGISQATTVSLSNNALTGTVPDIGNLLYFTADNNRLSGEVEEWFLDFFDISVAQNCFTCPLPEYCATSWCMNRPECHGSCIVPFSVTSSRYTTSTPTKTPTATPTASFTRTPALTATRSLSSTKSTSPSVTASSTLSPGSCSSCVHGSCFDGTCVCFDGWTGASCSTERGTGLAIVLVAVSWGSLTVAIGCGALHLLLPGPLDLGPLVWVGLPYIQLLAASSWFPGSFPQALYVWSGMFSWALFLFPVKTMTELNASLVGVGLRRRLLGANEAGAVMGLQSVALYECVSVVLLCFGLCVAVIFAWQLYQRQTTDRSSPADVALLADQCDDDDNTDSQTSGGEPQSDVIPLYRLAAVVVCQCGLSVLTAAFFPLVLLAFDQLRIVVTSSSTVSGGWSWLEVGLALIVLGCTVVPVPLSFILAGHLRLKSQLESHPSIAVQLAAAFRTPFQPPWKLSKAFGAAILWSGLLGLAVLSASLQKLPLVFYIGAALLLTGVIVLIRPCLRHGEVQAAVLLAYAAVLLRFVAASLLNFEVVGSGLISTLLTLLVILDVAVVAALAVLSFPFVRARMAALLESRPEQAQHSNELRPLEEIEHTTLEALLEDPDVVVISWEELTVHHRIGRGASAIVWAGYHESSSDSELVAIKEIMGDLSSMTDRALRRLLFEVHVLNRVSHENVIDFKGISVHEDSLCIVMELMEGGNLENVRDNESIGRKLEALCDMMRGIAYLHSLGLIHRDIKPQNILLTKSGECKVADFGIATISDCTSAKSRVGTPLYVAPEVLVSGSYSMSADIYSCGVVIAEVIIGHRPAREAAAYQEELNLTGLPGSFRTTVEQAVAQEPGLRPSAAELCEQLVELASSFDAW